jgi:cell shape-determining protein MreC
VNESDNNTAGGIILKWAHLALILLVQVLMMGAVYGSLRFQVEDHARRLESIEKKQDANFISREEYVKRHSDLQEEIRELRIQIREVESKIK